MKIKKACKHKPFYNAQIAKWKCSLCSRVLTDSEAKEAFEARGKSKKPLNNLEATIKPKGMKPKKIQNYDDSDDNSYDIDV